MACGYDGSKYHSTSSCPNARGGGMGGGYKPRFASSQYGGGQQGYGGGGGRMGGLGQDLGGGGGFGNPEMLGKFGGGGNPFTGYNAETQIYPRFAPNQQSYMSNLLGYLNKNVAPKDPNMGLGRLPQMEGAPNMPGIYQSQNFLQNQDAQTTARRAQLEKTYFGQMYPEAHTNLTNVQGETGRSGALDAANYGLHADLRQKLAAFDEDAAERQRQEYFQQQQAQEQANATRFGYQQAGALGRGQLGVQRYQAQTEPLLRRADLRLRRELGRQGHLASLSQLALQEPYTMGRTPGTEGFLSPLLGGAANLAASYFGGPAMGAAAQSMFRR